MFGKGFPLSNLNSVGAFYPRGNFFPLQYQVFESRFGEMSWRKRGNGIHLWFAIFITPAGFLKTRASVDLSPISFPARPWRPVHTLTIALVQNLSIHGKPPVIPAKSEFGIDIMSWDSSAVEPMEGYTRLLAKMARRENLRSKSMLSGEWLFGET